MNLSTNPGRVAGLLYLLLVAGGPLRLMVIPKTLFVRNDASATADNILAHETLFRFGMASEIFCAVALVFLVLAFYRLFEGIDRRQAMLVVIFGGVMPACMNFFNVVNDAAALLLMHGADVLAVIDKPQRDALAVLFLRLHYHESVASETLWGLWLLPLAILVYRSRFVPRLIGVWLAINGVAYVALSVTGLLLPQYVDRAWSLAYPALLGEIALMLWLVIKGVSQQALGTTASLRTTASAEPGRSGGGAANPL